MDLQEIHTFTGSERGMQTAEGLFAMLGEIFEMQHNEIILLL